MLNECRCNGGNKVGKLNNEQIEYQINNPTEDCEIKWEENW